MAASRGTPGGGGGGGYETFGQDERWVPGGGGGSAGGPAPTREQFTTPGSGGDQWSSSIQLSPEQQNALSAQMRIGAGRSNAAESLLGQATGEFQKPMDWGSATPRAQAIDPSQLPARPGQLPNDTSGIQSQIAGAGGLRRDVGGAGDYRQTAQNAVWNLQKPMLDERRAGLETQLANMGLPRGSEAWAREMRGMGDEENRARLSAIDSGRVEAQQAFGQNLQSGQFVNAAQGQQFGENTAQGVFGNSAAQQRLSQLLSIGGFNQGNRDAALREGVTVGNFNNANRELGLSEEMMRRSQPLNELNALLTGQQVRSPQMPSFNPAGRAAEPNYMGAADRQYSAALDASNADNAGTAGLMSGLFGLGKAGINNPQGAASLFSLFTGSDRRLKKDIVYVFTLPNKIKVYKYRFIGSDRTELGVIAQEVQETMPEAVRADSHGFLRVNYDMVLA